MSWMKRLHMRPGKETSPTRFALGFLGISIIGSMFSSQQEYFYVNVLGLPATISGLAGVIYALWDAINDPLAGVLSDRTKSPFGRRKPWLLAAVPLYTIAFILFFTVPEGILASKKSLFFYFATMLCVVETISTVQLVNYGAMGAELFYTTAKRARAMAFKQGGQLIAMILGIAVAQPLGNAIGFDKVALIYGIPACIIALYSFSGCNENPEAQKAPTVPLKTVLPICLKDRGFWTSMLGTALPQLGLTFIMAGFGFYIEYSLKLPDLMKLVIMASVIIAAIPSVLLWEALVKRIGAHKAWIASIILEGIAVIPLAFTHSLIVAIISGLGIGVAFSGFTTAGEVVGLNVVTAAMRRAGRHFEGTYGAIRGFLAKIVALPRPLGLTVIALLFGFISGKEPGAHADEAFRFYIAVFPSVCAMLGLIFALLHRAPTLEETLSEPEGGLKP